jgi:hypothetical protein
MSASKAARAEIRIGHLIVDGFQLPDGSYRMSLSQAAEAIGLSARNAFDFLQSKAFKSLTGDGYTVSIVEIEASQTRFRALPLEAVSVYWAWQSFRGNKTALALTVSLTTESLERRFDSAFGISVSELDYQQRLADRVSQLENDFGDDLAMGDIYRNWVAALEQQLRDNGIEPWQLPPLDEGSDRP